MGWAGEEVTHELSLAQHLCPHASHIHMINKTGEEVEKTGEEVAHELSLAQHLCPHASHIHMINKAFDFPVPQLHLGVVIGS